MSTPLEVRNRRREAQRTVRLAINAVHNRLDAWKAAVDEGKKHATDLTNDILTSGHIPQLPLAALSDVPGLKAATLHKLCTQMERHLAALEGSLRALEAAADGLAAALAPLTELAEQESVHPLLGTGPVFTLLPLNTTVSMMDRIRASHANELGAKAAAVAGFRLKAAEAQQRAQEAADGGSFKRPKGEDQAVEAFLRVHITAWMLSAGVDEATQAVDLAALSQDANSC